MEKLTPDLLLAAYASGYFPMAAHRHASELQWYCPDPRAILPLESFHVPRSLAKFMRRKPFTITTDRAFTDVIRACAERQGETWINDEIIELYDALHRLGYAHSVECWQEGTGRKILAGGLYGVALGRAFFGESMFTRIPNASRVALVELVSLLKDKHYALLDTQFVNPHLVQFGVTPIPRQDYLKRLRQAVTAAPEGKW